MTIKITKEGMKPEERVFAGTCFNCKTQFECQRKDGDYRAGDVRDGEMVTIKCPLCGNRANAYPLPGGQLVPRGKREPLTWGAESFYDR